VDHLGDVLDRQHLAFEHGENFRQRHRAHLHVAQRKLFSRILRVKSSINSFSRHREAFDDPPFFAVEGSPSNTCGKIRRREKSIPPACLF